jgi:hypothetical protein
MQQPSGRQSSRGLRSNSSRMNAAQTSASGSGAGRASARVSSRGSSVARNVEEPPARSTRRTRGSGGKELLICGGVIVVLVLVCGILYVKRSGDEQKAGAAAAAIKQIQERNRDKAFKAFTMAQSVGFDFVNGKKPDATRESLVSGLQGDPNIYNVIFTWTYKKKTANVPVQHALYPDPEHMNVKQTAKATMKEGINIVYGYNTKDQPIMISTKTYPPPATEKNNLGGEIMVITNAENENQGGAPEQ